MREGIAPTPAAQKSSAPSADNSKRVKVNLSALVGAGERQAAPEPNVYSPKVEKSPCDLYLKVPGENSGEFNRVKSILEIYNYGRQDVYIYFDDTKKLVRALDTHAFVTDTMLETLGRILGKENVKLKEKK